MKKFAIIQKNEPRGLPVCLQVRVMVRICSVHSSESSESMSLLKVDGRRKQLTLCETSAGGLSAAQRRSSSSSPKTFMFDAVFLQDASQVRRDLDRSTFNNWTCLTAGRDLLHHTHQ